MNNLQELDNLLIKIRNELKARRDSITELGLEREYEKYTETLQFHLSELEQEHGKYVESLQKHIEEPPMREGAIVNKEEETLYDIHDHKEKEQEKKKGHEVQRR
ncbi:MAG: hypothetical protein H2212_03485 [Ruminococcus sp.]|nr:hypothetical protein [Ruminococcus sp.]